LKKSNHIFAAFKTFGIVAGIVGFLFHAAAAKSSKPKWAGGLEGIVVAGAYTADKSPKSDKPGGGGGKNGGSTSGGPRSAGAADPSGYGDTKPGGGGGGKNGGAKNGGGKNGGGVNNGGSSSGGSNGGGGGPRSAGASDPSGYGTTKPSTPVTKPAKISAAAHNPSGYGTTKPSAVPSNIPARVSAYASDRTPKNNGPGGFNTTINSEMGGGASRKAQLEGIDAGMKAAKEAGVKSNSKEYMKAYYSGVHNSYVSAKLDPSKQPLTNGPMEAINRLEKTTIAEHRAFAAAADKLYREKKDVDITVPGTMSQADLAAITDPLARFGIDKSVVIDASAKDMFELFEKMGFTDLPPDMKGAAAKAYSLAAPGGVIIMGRDVIPADEYKEILTHEGIHAGVYAAYHLGTKVGNKAVLDAANAVMSQELDIFGYELGNHEDGTHTYPDSAHEVLAYVGAGQIDRYKEHLHKDYDLTDDEVEDITSTVVNDANFKEISKTLRDFAIQNSRDTGGK